jgi:hypothetical protein
LDDELGPCRLAARLQVYSGSRLSGAYEDERGELAYTDDTEAWFGMGLLSRWGKPEADKRKRENELTHGRIFASMLGIEGSKPSLVLPEALVEEARESLGGPGVLIGLNTGASGRWSSKGLSVERSVELAGLLHAALGSDVRFGARWKRSAIGAWLSSWVQGMIWSCWMGEPTMASWNSPHRLLVVTF